jgi:V/A-type H+-transporting ATPase subunit I
VLFLHGALAAITGALELVGAVGNVLSYLRLAAVGLASVYLAIVANEFAVVAPAGIGIVVATLLHTLNVALAGLSPTVQALRLHYVEFFQKFLIGGGRPFRPFGAATAAA